MSNITLHPHQQSWTSDIDAQLARSDIQGVCAVGATGVGKTVVLAEKVHRTNAPVAICVHRKEILAQISTTLAGFGVRHRVIAPDKVQRYCAAKHYDTYGRNFVDPYADAGLMSAQTLCSKATQAHRPTQAWLKRVRLAVYDEGHHYVQKGTWSKAVESLAQEAKRVFFTATPQRADGVGLGSWAGGYCDVLVQGPQTGWLIDNGWLSPYRYFVPDTAVDLEGMSIGKTGDVVAKQHRPRMQKAQFYGEMVDHYERYAPGAKSILFASDVESAYDFEAQFISRGWRAKVVHGAMADKERDGIIDAYKLGTPDAASILVNVDLFDEGFDVPAAECAMFGRRTLSLAKYLQMCGRVLRRAKGKVARIIDPVDNIGHNGRLPPCKPRTWTLDSRDSRGRGAGLEEDEIRYETCRGCSQLKPAYLRICPICGHEKQPAGRSTPEQVDGDLCELDLNAYTALKSEYDTALLDPGAYRARLQAKGAPYTRQAVQAHTRKLPARRALKYAQDVWFTANPGEDRKFFALFGIDPFSAVTQDEAAARSLIDRIARNLTRD